MLLLDILVDVASDTFAGERFFTALKRHFVEERNGSLDVSSALQRRRRHEGAARTGRRDSDSGSSRGTSGSSPNAEQKAALERWAKKNG